MKIYLLIYNFIICIIKHIFSQSKNIYTTNLTLYVCWSVCLFVCLSGYRCECCWRLAMTKRTRATGSMRIGDKFRLQRQLIVPSNNYIQMKKVWVGKQLTYTINTTVRSTVHLNQWKNTNEVIIGFNNIPVQLSSGQFAHRIRYSVFLPIYNSRSTKKGISLCSYIHKHQIRGKKHNTTGQKFLLYNPNSVWSKTSTNDLFDVPMRSSHRAETCKFFGLYLLHIITTSYGKHFGLYS